MRSLFGGLREVLAKAPVPFVGRQLAMPLTTTNNTTTQMRAYGAVGTLFSIVSRLATAVSLVNWKLYRKAASGREEDRTEVTSHLALQIWNKPNDYYSRQALVEAGEQHMDLTGETWLVVERNEMARSIPLGLWCVRPDRMAPVPSATEFIAGYVYLGPDGERVPLRRDDVLMAKMPSPLDPYRGMGPVQAILTDLDSIRYSAEWNRNFFINSAQPGGIIELNRTLGDDEWDQFVARWEEQHKGVAQAHRVAIIEEGVWRDRNYTMKDMQFVELRNVSREVVREAFGMPKFAVGDVDDVNRATADASATWFGRQLTVPRLERWKGMLNSQFLPMFGATGQGLEFDYVQEDAVPADQAAQDAQMTATATAVKTYVDAGADLGQVLAMLNLPPLATDGGSSPQALTEMIQKIYLGVGTVITEAEAREILNRAGAGLDLGVDVVPAVPPTPAAPTARIELVLPFDQNPSTTRPTTRRERRGRTS